MKKHNLDDCVGMGEKKQGYSSHCSEYPNYVWTTNKRLKDRANPVKRKEQKEWYGKRNIEGLCSYWPLVWPTLTSYLGTDLRSRRPHFLFFIFIYAFPSPP